MTRFYALYSGGQNQISMPLKCLYPHNPIPVLLENKNIDISCLYWFQINGFIAIRVFYYPGGFMSVVSRKIAELHPIAYI